MSFQNMTFTSQCVAIGLLLFGIQNTSASANEISNFQDALAKVQQYQSQFELQQQRQQLAILNTQNSSFGKIQLSRLNKTVLVLVRKKN